MLLDQMKNMDVKSIMTDPYLSRRERIEKLTKIRDEARGIQRMASEGGMIESDGLNADLHEIDMALDQLGKSLSEQDSKGPASL